MAYSCQILAERTAEGGEMLCDPTLSMGSRPDHSPNNKANTMTTYGHPEVRHEESATDKAGNPYMTEHDGMAFDSKNADACMLTSPPLPPSPS